MGDKIDEIIKTNQDKKIEKSKKIVFKSFSTNNILVNVDKPKDSKEVYNLKDSTIINNKNNTTNPNIYNEMDYNKYLIYKLKKKLKQAHNNNKLKELEYLERIAVLQCKLNLYEYNFEKVLIENNLIKNKKYRNFLNCNCNCTKKSIENKGEKYLNRPFSSISDVKTSFLKKKIKKFMENHKNNNNSVVESYISANKNKNSIESYECRNKKLNAYYKYQIGNNYLRNDFRQIKKTIHNNNTKITKLMNNCKKVSTV